MLSDYEDADNMFKIIKIEVRDVYGRQKIYPICENAKRFARIAGTTTLTFATLKLIEELGYTWEIHDNEISYLKQILKA